MSSKKNTRTFTGFSGDTFWCRVWHRPSFPQTNSTPDAFECRQLIKNIGSASLNRFFSLRSCKTVESMQQTYCTKIRNSKLNDFNNHLHFFNSVIHPQIMDSSTTLLFTNSSNTHNQRLVWNRFLLHRLTVAPFHRLSLVLLLVLGLPVVKGQHSYLSTWTNTVFCLSVVKLVRQKHTTLKRVTCNSFPWNKC